MKQDLQKATELANRYTLVRRLGGVGACETWLAQDRMTRAQVALKVLTDADAAMAGALHKEWQTSIRLMHAHIVRVFEFNDDTDCPFYSLQFIDGPDIGVLTGAAPDELLPPVALIADALRYAHGKGFVHRDIKASNVLLDHNGAPYLIDFGVAAPAGAQADGGSLIAATPQSLAGEPAQPSDDIFALGGMIYELVSGNPPYSAQSTAADIAQALPPLLQSAGSFAVPDSVQKLVSSMLDKDATRRPDAAAVVAALRDAGYAGGPAPQRLVSQPKTSGAERIEASATIHARSRPDVAGTVAQDPGNAGLSPRNVGIGLAVLLLVLLGVVFLLPDSVTVEQQSVPELADDAEVTDEEQPPAAAGDAVPQRDERVVARAETEEVLGELLSKLDTLDKRAVQRWGGLRYKQAQAVYAEGDEAYLARNYAAAIDKYREAIDMVEPLLDQVDGVFEKAFSDGQAALEAADAAEALRLFELAAAISPSDAAAQAGYARAKNLDTVLALTDRGLAYEKDLELEAARQSFAQAIELDALWLPAKAGLDRVNETIRQMEFDLRMSEGLAALAEGDYPGARAAFRVAKKLKPASQEPADGLLQVDQGIRLGRITSLEQSAQAQERNEEWESAVQTYGSILEIDANLMFAQEGLARATQMTALHKQLDDYIGEPDRLSSPSTMRSATTLVVDITRMPEIGPRLTDQRDELSRLLKRAATPIAVQLVSDSVTDVSIYKVGKLGSFATQQLSLRPGTYVAVGSRPGYRDVRLEFRVGPEVEARPIVVRCEEPI